MPLTMLRVVVPHKVVWHSFHLSSLTPSFLYLHTFPLSFLYYQADICSNTVLQQGTDPRRCAPTRRVSAYPPSLSVFRVLIFSPHEGRSSSGFLLSQIDVSLLPSESDWLPPLTVPDLRFIAMPFCCSRGTGSRRGGLIRTLLPPSLDVIEGTLGVMVVEL